MSSTSTEQENNMEDRKKDHEKDQLSEYEPPTVVDYGTLVDITRSGHLANRDIPAGNPGSVPNSAFSP